ncbi:MAG: DUF2894 domain-containing protein [Ramlibacter sp.]
MSTARQWQQQALARRLADQGAPVQALLRARLQAAAQAPAPEATRTTAVQSQPRPGAVPWPRTQHTTGELASAARFRRAWSRSRAQDSVAMAAAQRLPNAGPLNSQVLALQSLQLMHTLPGDYLRRFVAHVEALQWLQAMAPLVTAPARKPKRARSTPAGR